MLRRASGNAVRQFLAHGLHTTQDRSGVLIFVSLAEHYAEVIADAGINEKVDQSQWDSMIAVLVDCARQGRVADGFVQVIEVCGTLLAEHFPELNDWHVEFLATDISNAILDRAKGGLRFQTCLNLDRHASRCPIDAPVPVGVARRPNLSASNPTFFLRKRTWRNCGGRSPRAWRSNRIDLLMKSR